MKQKTSRLLRAMILAFTVGGLAGCSSDVQLLTHPEKPRLQGVALYNRGDLSNAAGAFKNAIRQEPRDYKAHFYLGETYEAQGNYQQAIQEYKASVDSMKATLQGQEAIDLRQKVMNRLGATIARGDDQNLEKDLLAMQAADARLSDQRRAEAYFLLAKIQRYRGDADSAIAAYAKGSELDAKDYWLQKEAGIYMLQAGQKQQANAPLARASKINTHDPELNQAIADIGGLVKDSDLSPGNQTKLPPGQIIEPITDK